MIQTNNITKTSVSDEAGRKSISQSAGTPPPDPEVIPRQTRRNHTVAYKIKVVKTVAVLRAEGHGAVGEFLRREGLYYSMVKRWERQYSEGTIVTASRGPKQKSHQSLIEENKKLRRKLEQLEQHLAKTEMIVELQKKLSSILDLTPKKNHDKSDAE